jgi:LysM repeat protein
MQARWQAYKKENPEMKAYAKIALLVALVLLVTLTACTRSATTLTAAVVPTSTGEAPFPFTTPNAGGVADFGTQTAIARTPQVLLATTTPAPGEQPAAVSPTEAVGQGGGQPEGTEAGGGVTEPQQQPAAQQPAAPANLTAIERPSSYTIQKGEHPFCIARRYNVDPNSLLSANGLGRNSVVSIGTTLVIPGAEWSVANFGSRALQSHPTSYTVASGDTVNSIACKFGDVYPEHILQQNGLGSAADVQAGMTLQIP